VPDHDNLREIKTFPSLVRYLRDELDWPIEADDFEDLTFDYEPEELGIDAKTAAKIEQIKQLRPLESNQPWGIFFVKFEPKRLPVMALRRILSRLVIKKRTSAKKSDQPSWHMHDLLFISNYGEGEQRQITFAHFAQDEIMGDLPTLKVLGWDDADTALHIDHAHQELKEKLHWQEDDEKISDWRSRWSSLFSLRHREVITTSKALSERLAKLAADIRKRVNTILRLETDKGPIRKLQTDFKTALIHDLSDDDFADMYAQTITYGLLTARVSRPAGLVADNITDMVPGTNPFLRDLMSTFLTVGGRKGKVDFDEVGINDVVQTLREANMGAVLRDFGDRKPDEDPVIFFYEDFLKAYDKRKKVQRGVFYTPKPVVSYIVRSVHEILQKEFGLEDGLADTITWGEMVKKFPSQKEGKPGLQIPSGTSLDTPFVQILDPANGTGTFLVEVIEVIFRTLTAKWEQKGLTKEHQRAAWDDYVPKHLLPRLHGYELMMAPYAIAHMKIGLKLYETGYRFGSDERARIYLTNALEPPSDYKQQYEFEELLPALAHEAHAVNEIKRKQRFTVVIGNPPYSNFSANLKETARALIGKYKVICGERVTERNALQLERNLNDDYVKFIAWSEDRLHETGIGILSMISNNVYTWSPSLRGMRAHLMNSFSRIRIIDLHGASQRGPTDSRFVDDKNVFDIEQPVAIGIFYSPHVQRESSVGYAEIVGTRETKYQILLQQSLQRGNFELVTPTPLAWRFVPSASEFKEYDSFFLLSSTCPLFAEGIKTGRDWLVTDFEKEPILERMNGIQSSKESDAELCNRIGLSPKKAWNFAKARSKLVGADLSSYISKLSFRPFEMRFVFYHPNWIASSSTPVMRNLSLAKTVHQNTFASNLALLAGRISRDQASRLYWCSRDITDKCILSSLDNVSVFPALVFPAISANSLNFGEIKPEANLSKDFLIALHQRLGLKKPTTDAESLRKWTFDILHYSYAILWSPSYRMRYGGELNADFPRLPLTWNLGLFRALSRLGGELVALHLMESPKLENYVTEWIGKIPSGELEKVIYSDDTVWIDKTKKEGFLGIPEDIWNFHIGGYQVCQKWLKDRKGRQLSKDDVDHYQKIVVALNETIRLMTEIDEVINTHGGWPDAFQTSGVSDSKTYESETFEYLKAAEELPEYGKPQKKQ
jgi:predicted helicase